MNIQHSKYDQDFVEIVAKLVVGETEVELLESAAHWVKKTLKSFDSTQRVIKLGAFVVGSRTVASS